MKPLQWISTQAAVVSIITLTLFAPVLQAQEPGDAVHALWVAETQGLLKVGLDDGSILLGLPATAPVRAVDVDLARLRVWTVAGSWLRGYEMDGTPFSETELSIPQASEVFLKVAPGDGSVWIGLQRQLLNISEAGQALQEVFLEHPLEGLSVAPSGSRLWVATRKSVSALDPVTGEEVERLQSAQEATVRDVAVSADGAVWVAAEDAVRRYEDGALTLEVVIEDARQVATLPDGSAWVAGRKQLVLVPTDGSVSEPVLPFAGRGVMEALVADPVDHSAWVATQAAIAQVHRSGEPSLAVDFQEFVRIWDLSLSADVIPPLLSIVSPADGALLATKRPTIQIAFSDVGEGVDVHSVMANLNGVLIPASCTEQVHGSAYCQLAEDLPEGELLILLTVRDHAGNVSESQDLHLVIDTVPPLPADLERITVEPTDGGQVVISGASGSVEPSVQVELHNLDSGAAATTAAAADGSFQGNLAAESGDDIQISSTDKAGNLSTGVVVRVPVSDGGLPDPASVAPPLDSTVPTDIVAATSFLYTGPHPIQEGVTTGTIDPHRAAVVRGRVVERSGAPVASVAVRILGHPELGATQTRADGMFDLVVNGGGRLTLAYQKSGYLAVQRPISTPWRDFVWAEDVVLVPYDEAVTVVDLAEVEAQVARGSTEVDEDGPRRATVIFPGSTVARLVLPSGGRVHLDELSFRATEYTVGPQGPRAMPAPLPASSGYTYAVELSADEAVASGALRIEFVDPVFLYVENFLEFPVGSVVPAGFFDKEESAWTASDNGRVIRILSPKDGKARVDLHGNGAPATPEMLMAMGFTDGELAQLAETYEPGQSLWRTPIPHFTPWDCNWPYGPPEDAEPPPEPDDDKPQEDDLEESEEKADDDPEPDEDDPCEQLGSIVECENQILGESVRVAGTPYRMNYRSYRVPGRSVARRFKVRLSGSDVPSDLKRIELVIDVAGRRFHHTFSPAPHRRYTFEWDGKDAYGRRIGGPIRATARVGYVYPVVYYEPDEVAASFGRFSSSTEITGSRESGEVTLWRQASKTMGVWDARGQGLGGWTLDPHHVFDSDSGVLYLGNGSRLTSRSLGNGRVFSESIIGSDGSVVEWTADGTVYVVEMLSSIDFIWEHPPDDAPRLRHSTTSHVRVRDIAIAPNGDIYYTTTGCTSSNPSYVRRVGPGDRSWDDADTLLTWPEVLCPQGLAAGPNGDLFILDNDKILRRAPGGRVDIVLEGNRGGGISTARLLVAPDGSLYFTEPSNSWVRRLGVDGRVATVAGTGERGFSGDGGPATAARLNSPLGLALDGNGGLLIADRGNHRLRRVSPGGIIQTVAGTGEISFGLSFHAGSPALATILTSPEDVAVSADGTVYVSTRESVLIMRPPLPGFSEVGYSVASPDGQRVYTFDATGRHRQTLSALDGQPLLDFGYDASGRLVAIEDADGNRTRVERNAQGHPVAILSPTGMRTVLQVDDDGYLTKVTDPAGTALRLDYTSTGLLTRVDGAEGTTQTFGYASGGRLIQDTGERGERKELTRRLFQTGYEVDLTTALGRTSTYRVEKLSAGGTLRSVTSAAGLTTTVFKPGDGRAVRSDPDGTTVTVQHGPDPRWGMSAPIAERYEISLPSGRSYVSEHARTVSLFDQANPLSVRRMTDTWSENGRLFARTYESRTRSFTLISPEGRSRVIQVDGVGRPAVLEPGGLNPVRFVYDGNGRLAEIREGNEPETRVTGFAFDGQGFLEQVTDPLGRSTHLERDAVGRLLRQVLPNGDEIRFSYDDAGRLTSIIPPGRPPHRFGYYADGRLKTYDPASDPEVEDQTTFAYSRDGQLVSVLQASGRSVALAYGLSGRLESITVPEGIYRYSFDTSSGQLVEMVSPDGSTAQMEYDGHLLTATTWSGEVQGRVERGYDDNLWLETTRVNGKSVSFERDEDGLLTRAGELSLTRNSATGLVTETRLGVVSTVHGHNRFGEPADLTVLVDGAEVYSVEMRRDPAGRIVERTETFGGLSTTYAYTYDLLGRLTAVTRDGVAWASYAYDPNGNRVGYDGQFGQQQASYDDRDRILSYGDSSFSFGPDGDLQSETAGAASVTFEHDVLGHLRAANLADGRQIEYLLDAANRRLGKKVDGALVQGWLYEGQRTVAAEVDHQGDVLSRFVYASRGNVPDYMRRNGRTYRIVADHRGSPLFVIDGGTGEIAQRMEYDAFGRVLLDTAPGFQPFGLAGGLRDRHTGLVHFGTREYDPRLGRWTTSDPIGFAGLDTNLYAYVGNDPVNRIDPLGWLELPGDPSDLPSDWTHDPSHRDPNGQRFRHPNGDVLDFHKGRPGEPGWRGRDHWHHNGGKDHLRPGDEIPEPSPEGAPDGGPSEFCRIDDPVGNPVPYWVAAGAGAGIILATLIEDMMTGGLGIADDPATIGVGVALIVGTTTLGEGGAGANAGSNPNGGAVP